MSPSQSQRSISLIRLIRQVCQVCQVCMLLAVSASSVFSQVGRASLTGIVRDQTSSVVPSVTVMAVNVATGVSYQTTTNDEGVYTLGALPVGQYRITFRVAGFKEVIREGVSLTAGQIARIDPAFEIGAVTEKVTVTAETSLLQTESSQSSSSVTSRVFLDLPLNFGGGRNMAEFADAQSRLFRH